MAVTKEKATKRTSKKLAGTSRPSKLVVSPKTTAKEPQTMEELLAQTGYSLHGFKRGQEVTGTILSIRSGEIVVDIGGKSEGLVAGRELEYIRGMIRDFAVGQTITATVSQPENDQGATLLSLRRLSGDRHWQDLEKHQEENTAFTVAVLDVNRGGLVVDALGMRGFVPASQLTVRQTKLTDLIGSKLTVKIVELDRKGNRLVLSEKQVYAKEIAEKSKEKLKDLTIGKRYSGIITSVMPFGVFVNIDGIEGLVHISEVSWSKLTDLHAFFKPGQAQEVVIIGIDPEAGKLHLSIRQLTEDPWVRITKEYTAGQTITGKVTKQTTFGVFVEVEPGVEGLMHSSQVPQAGLAPGSTVSCIIEAIQGLKRRMSLRLAG